MASADAILLRTYIGEPLGSGGTTSQQEELRLLEVPRSRRRGSESEDEEGTFKPTRPRRSKSREEWERSWALAVQEEELRRQLQLEQEQMDISLAMRLMEESRMQQHDDEDRRRQEQEQSDIELARALLEDERERQQELTDILLARSLVEENQGMDFDLLRHLDDESRIRRRFRISPVEQLLEPCQQLAVDYVKKRADEMHNNALPTLLSRVIDMGFTPQQLQTCLAYIRDDAPIVIHLSKEALTKLVDDTHYRNLFEVHTSGGCQDKSRRNLWESTMFGNCYDEQCAPFDRPKYGCLNVTGDLAGVRSARRYGSCFVTLHEHVRNRATFFDRDTGGFVAERTLATNEHYAHILNQYDDTDLQAAMNVACNSRIGGARSACSVYKEVQIHGPICLATDIQALSLEGREADATLEFREVVLRFQRKTNCNVLWQLDLLDPPEFR